MPNTTDDYGPISASAGATPGASGTTTPHTHGESSTHIRQQALASAHPSAAGPPPDPAVEYTFGLPPAAALAGLSATSRRCIENFVAHGVAAEHDVGLARRAAVLIAVFQRPGEDGLRVLLTTRAKHLRRNPSQTALPGGQRDATDPSAAFNARREAYEEVGLPASHASVHMLTVLDPILTVLPLNAPFKHHIVVTPVVAFIDDPALVDSLTPNPDEVDCIFDHPLGAVWTGEPEDEVKTGLATHGGEWWPHGEDYHSREDRVGATGPYRMHRFRTRHSPIKGFTSNVLISAAAVAYAAEPAYGHFAAGQRRFSDAIHEVVSTLPTLSSSPPQNSKPLEWGLLAGGSQASGETYYRQ
ncbi:Nudix hydrolase 15, mitochondrial [Vanrija pseudolonga]|uniref:Nudix hydrolase 15, mitochondrial n=1 Tax=Vanrija pseudolonga TaxID=143232 RepID=A0AAF1BP57_9TREE|nr:Nudix hydrolase 15, mitochondrial [Vanrija pseudolonga]